MTKQRLPTSASPCGSRTERVIKFSIPTGAPSSTSRLNRFGVGESNPESEMFGKAMDIWALGCTFYQLIYNEFPFEVGIKQEEFIQNVLTKEYLLVIQRRIS